MQIINEKHMIIKDKWYLQSFNLYDNYILSPYVSIFPQEDGKELWYNMLTGELILMDKDEAINNKDTYKKLVQNWFYINIELNPKSVAFIVSELIKNEYRKNSKEVPDKYVITSTFVCNAQCHYCYENELRQRPMTDEVALDIGKFLVKQAEKRGNQITINWFGGEPLCGSNAIRIISKHLKDNDISFNSSMITNGYLISEFPIKEIRREWNLTSCQITLDGTKENYQKIKNFKNKDENAYERVLNNIETFLENGIFTTIRLNVGKDNAEDLFQLTKELVEKFKEYKGLINIYTSPLFECIESNYMVMEMPDSIFVHNYCKKINEYVAKNEMYHLKKSKFEYKIGHCMADSGKPIVITVDGNLSPCEHHFDDCICGNIWEGVTDTAPLEMFKERNKNLPECENCFYYPKCARLKHCPTEFICKDPQRDFIKYELQLFVEDEYRNFLNGVKGDLLC